jgi:hypothetical protein
MATVTLLQQTDFTPLSTQPKQEAGVKCGRSTFEKNNCVEMVACRSGRALSDSSLNTASICANSVNAESIQNCNTSTASCKYAF